jgi:hypothetical protein
MVKPSVAQIVRASHEPKNWDSTASQVAFPGSTTPVIVLLNAIVQGVTGNDRTGRQVHMESLRLGLFFNANQSDNMDDLVRIMVVLDRECRGAQFTDADLWTNNSTTAGQIVSSYDFDNVPNRFTILHDEVILLAPTAYNGTTLTQKRFPVTINKSLKSRKVHYYNASAGTIADIDSGALFLVLQSLNTINPSQYSYDVRVVFRDV